MRKLFAKLFYKLFGWTFVGKLPEHDKYVLLCVHHTSNWDYVYFLITCWLCETHIHWLGKHTLFKGPLGAFFRWTGGVSVDRTSSQGLVEQLAEEFEKRDKLHLAIPPSGTRSYRDYWKSGFYHIAQAANVPVVLGVLDYKKKECGFGPEFMLSGDVRADMDRIRDYYTDVTGKYPDQAARIRLRSEDEPDGEPV
jgi:1-acyl-sn-glycerol-3-phosphate acyltransferase